MVQKKIQKMENYNFPRAFLFFIIFFIFYHVFIIFASSGGIDEKMIKNDEKCLKK